MNRPGLGLTGGGWLRRWRQRPLIVIQFLVTISVGMGGAAALVSLMLALGYQPLPFRDPGSLVQIWERVESGAPVTALSGPDLEDFAEATRHVFSAIGAFSPARKLWLIDRRGAAEIPACYIQASVLSDLGIQPALGRGAQLDDEPSGKGSASPVWISDRLWRSRYGGSPSVIGAAVGMGLAASGDGAAHYRIAGVLPPGVSLPLPFTEGVADVWYLAEPNLAARSRQSDIFFGIGRLRPGVTAAQAQTALAIVAEQLGQRYSFDSRKRPVVEGLEAIAQAPARQTMGLLVLGVAFVFLVGCVNLAILMGTEGRQRRREIAIRFALGAPLWRLRCETAAEKCLLTLISLALGAGFAAALLRVMTQWLPAAGLGPALLHAPPLNLAVLLGFTAFALIATLVWSVLLVSASEGQQKARGLAAAGSGLGYSGFADSGRGAGRWRLGLLAIQAGVGICLLSAAAMAARTYSVLSVANLGPDPNHTVVMSQRTRDNATLSDAQVADFNRQALTELSRLPGTDAIALVDIFPPLGYPVSFREQSDPSGAEHEATSPLSVSSGYFRALGIPVLMGRNFDATDSQHSEPVAMISLDMARRNWSSPMQAVGAQIRLGTRPEDRYKIIGVVGDFAGYWSQQPMPTIYVSEEQTGNWCGQVILHTTLPPRTVAAVAAQMLGGIATPATVSDVSTMEELWQSTLTRPLARMASMMLLALLGLGLSVQGVYALAAASVAARTRELAVRSALGASARRLAWNVTGELVLSVLAGAAVGVVAVLELQPLLNRLIGTAAGWQAQPIAAAVALLALAAAAGCYLPARAAMKANPIDVLRQS